MLQKGLAEIYIYDDNPFVKALGSSSWKLEPRPPIEGPGRCDGNFHSES